MEKTKLLFIINPISGTSSKASVPLLIDKYIDKERFEIEVRYTERAGHAIEIATEARNNGIDVCVAVGGDGTVNEVARALTGSRTALGIIPFGSGNGLARHLLLPINVKGALRIINECVIRTLDYGVIDGHPFFCTCGMGFDAHISKQFAEAGTRGPITYAENIMKSGLSYKPETYEITMDGKQETFTAFLVSCANASQYGNNAFIAPQASMSDGVLDVVVMEPFDMLVASQLSFEMFTKTLDRHTKVKTFKARNLHIKRASEGPIHYDGDPAEAGKEIDVNIVPSGIAMVVNSHADKSHRQPNTIQLACSNVINRVNAVFAEVGNVVGDVKQTQEHQVRAINQFIRNKLR